MFNSRPDSLQEQLAQVEQPDVLGVLSTTREVVRQARSVQIEPARVGQLARLLTTSENKTEIRRARLAYALPFF